MMMKILAVALSVSVAPTFLLAQDLVGDAALGEKVFRKCKACHEVGAEAKSKTGPVLTGIVGRAAASVDGFGYSAGLTDAAAGGLVWDPESIDQFLTKPKDFVPGTKMTFAGLRKDADRENIIAYLASFQN